MKKLKLSKLLPDFRYLQKLVLNTGALARFARAAEHHGYENVVNYPSEKIW